MLRPVEQKEQEQPEFNLPSTQYVSYNSFRGTYIKAKKKSFVPAKKVWKK